VLLKVLVMPYPRFPVVQGCKGLSPGFIIPFFLSSSSMSAAANTLNNKKLSSSLFEEACAVRVALLHIEAKSPDSVAAFLPRVRPASASVLLLYLPAAAAVSIPVALPDPRGFHLNLLSAAASLVAITPSIPQARSPATLPADVAITQVTTGGKCFRPPTDPAELSQNPQLKWQCMYQYSLKCQK
jgi:hypothetical protein